MFIHCLSILTYTKISGLIPSFDIILAFRAEQSSAFWIISRNVSADFFGHTLLLLLLNWAYFFCGHKLYREHSIAWKGKMRNLFRIFLTLVTSIIRERPESTKNTLTLCVPVERKEQSTNLNQISIV